MIYNIFNLNLLGDGLFTTPALRAFAEKRLKEGDTLNLFTGPEPHTQIYGHLPYLHGAFAMRGDKVLEMIPPSHTAGKWVLEGNTASILLDIGEAFNFANATGLPYVQGFAKQLGVFPLKDLHLDAGIHHSHLVVGEATFEDKFIRKFKKPVIICSPISFSCNSRLGLGYLANKMVSAEVWKEVTDWLIDKYTFVFIATEEPGPFDILSNKVFWIINTPICIVATWLKFASLNVVLENGIFVLAQAMDANILGIIGAVPQQFTYVGTKGSFRTLDYGKLPNGVRDITAQQIIDAIEAHFEPINAKL